MPRKHEEFMKIKSMTIKVLAMLLIILMTFVYIAFLEQFLGEGMSYASGESLDSQSNSTNVDNITFDVYLDVNDRSKKTTQRDITATDLILYVQVKVQGGGILKEGEISFGEKNFTLQQAR